MLTQMGLGDVLLSLLGRTRWAFPLLVVGMDSIMMYVVVHVATAVRAIGLRPPDGPMVQ